MVEGGDTDFPGILAMLTEIYDERPDRLIAKSSPTTCRPCPAPHAGESGSVRRASPFA